MRLKMLDSLMKQWRETSVDNKLVEGRSTGEEHPNRFHEPMGEMPDEFKKLYTLQRQLEEELENLNKAFSTEVGWDKDPHIKVEATKIQVYQEKAHLIIAKRNLAQDMLDAEVRGHWPAMKGRSFHIRANWQVVACDQEAMKEAALETLGSLRRLSSLMSMIDSGW